MQAKTRDCFSQEEKDGIVDINDMRTHMALSKLAKNAHAVLCFLQKARKSLDGEVILVWFDYIIECHAD